MLGTETIKNTDIYFGWIATFISMACRFPQLVKIYKRKSGNDISLYMISFQNLAYVFYILYGLIHSDIIYITTSAISFVQNLMILYLYWYYKNKGQTHKETQTI